VRVCENNKIDGVNEMCVRRMPSGGNTRVDVRIYMCIIKGMHTYFKGMHINDKKIPKINLPCKREA
jgi:hypothetical protein